jgi:hypothetical protein
MQEIYHSCPDIEPRIKKSEYAMLSYILCVIMHNVDNVPRHIDNYLYLYVSNRLIGSIYPYPQSPLTKESQP